jgi:hypothetical protein
MVAEGPPQDVLNRYQKIIMAREKAFESAVASVATEIEGETSLLQPAFRHGDGSAEVRSVALVNASNERVEIVETGEPVAVRFRVVFLKDIEDPVFGFLIRNRHGIHVYGTNTRLQGLSFGRVRFSDTFEIMFSFNCSLAPDSYSITVASHSPDAVSFDWLDCVTYFQVISMTRMEGVANLSAVPTVTRISQSTPIAGVEAKGAVLR